MFLSDVDASYHVLSWNINDHSKVVSFCLWSVSACSIARTSFWVMLMLLIMFYHGISMVIARLFFACVSLFHLMCFLYTWLCLLLSWRCISLVEALVFLLLFWTWPKGRRSEFCANKKGSERARGVCSCHPTWGFSAKTERWVMEHGSLIMGTLNLPINFPWMKNSIWMVGKY